ncbi:MAG: hypothetical protein ACXQT4_04515, partial [Methanotrichaceae archaeon]
MYGAVTRIIEKQAEDPLLFREGDECSVPPKVVQIYNSFRVVDRTYQKTIYIWLGVCVTRC